MLKTTNVILPIGKRVGSTLLAHIVFFSSFINIYRKNEKGRKSSALTNRLLFIISTGKQPLGILVRIYGVIWIGFDRTLTVSEEELRI